ncbi:MAG: hypothetical protein QW156_03970 [Candidatus Aenigmatarchaeota archaeon]
MKYTTKIIGNKIVVEIGKVTMTIEQKRVSFDEPNKVKRVIAKLNLPIHEMKTNKKELDTWVYIIYNQFYQ